MGAFEVFILPSLRSHEPMAAVKKTGATPQAADAPRTNRDGRSENPRTKARIRWRYGRCRTASRPAQAPLFRAHPAQLRISPRTRRCAAVRAAAVHVRRARG